MIYVILSLSILIASVLAFILFKHHKQITLLQIQTSRHETLGNQLSKDSDTLIKADLAFSLQLQEINSHLISIENQIQALENQRDNDGGYQHAIRILEMGGDKEEIIKNCHLSHAEAELIINLQAYRAALDLSKQ